MTKKKSNRQKHQKDVCDTSDEELSKPPPYQGKCCSHVAKGVNFGRVKKLLKLGNVHTCSACANTPTTEEVDEVWLCLQCGNRGCGRLSTHQHALQHFKTIHSDCHSLVLSTSSGVVWCYDCDDEVQLESSGNLKQCVEFIMKIKISNNNVKTEINKKPCQNASHPDPVQSVEMKKNIDEKSAQQSLLETVLKDQTSLNKVSSEIVSRSENKNNCKSNREVATKVKGLRNLGNTCYFNAVMQNLSQTPVLVQCLEDICLSEIRWEVPQLVLVGDSVLEAENSDTLKISLPRESQLVNSFLKFLRKMLAFNNKIDVIDPSDLFYDIQRKSPQFQYFHQQDSHELLRQFLDGIRQDEVKRQKRAILKHFNIGNANSEIDDKIRKLIKAYGYYASHTTVEKIFGGLLISTVLCEECKMSSQVFEPFMDMSLPLFEEKPNRGRKSEPDMDENDGEYILTKSKKDYGKLSKHQEKKIKQLEKKEKKRTKKVQYVKQNMKQHASSLETENGISQTMDITVDHETGEQNHINPSIDDSDQLKQQHDEQNAVTEENDTSPVALDSVDIASKEIGEKVSYGSELKMANFRVDLRKNENSLSHTLLSVESSDQECVILFDEVVILNEEPIVETSSPSLENDVEIPKVPDKASLEPESEQDSSDGSQGTTHNDLLEELDKSIRTSSLDERMQALSMQMTELRIRRDSDRQESILSSPQSPDDSPKNNYDDDSPDDSDDKWSHNLTESQTKEWILKSLTTLKPRQSVSPHECSVVTCLTHFTKPELLAGNNKFRCENCSEIKRKKSGDKKAVAYSNASKQLLVFSPPAVLTLHLKRFQQVGMSLRKVNRFVEFPLTLDLAPYCSSACLILPHMASVKDEILYSLYGVVEHSGRLTSGHYTAYVKTSKQTLHKNFMNHLPLAQCDLEQLLHKFSKSNFQIEETPEENSTSKECHWFYVSDNHVKEVSEVQVLKCQAYLLFYERIK